MLLTSDHGELLGTDGYWDHCLGLMESLIRVPFLVLDRGGALGGYARGDMPVSTIDILPTLLAKAGQTATEPRYTGANLEDASPDRTVFAIWSGSWAIRNRELKLIESPDRGTRLYDFKRDPGELDNLAERHPATVNELRQKMREHYELVKRIDEETLETQRQLEAIGYVE